MESRSMSQAQNELSIENAQLKHDNQRLELALRLHCEEKVFPCQNKASFEKEVQQVIDRCTKRAEEILQRRSVTALQDVFKTGGKPE